jgi:hypothetical protein
MRPRNVREPHLEVLSVTFRSATPLSQEAPGPEALRPSITTGLPFQTNRLALSYSNTLCVALSLLIVLLMMISIDFSAILSVIFPKKFSKNMMSIMKNLLIGRIIYLIQEEICFYRSERRVLEDNLPCS